MILLEHSKDYEYNCHYHSLSLSTDIVTHWAHGKYQFIILIIHSSESPSINHFITCTFAIFVNDDYDYNYVSNKIQSHIVLVKQINFLYYKTFKTCAGIVIIMAWYHNSPMRHYIIWLLLLERIKDIVTIITDTMKMIFRIDDTVAGCNSRRLVSQLVNVKLFSSQTLVCVSFNPVWFNTFKYFPCYFYIACSNSSISVLFTYLHIFGLHNICIVLHNIWYIGLHNTYSVQSNV